MGDMLSFLTMRSVIIFGATTFSILMVMLVLNIITVDEVAIMLKMSPEATHAFKLVISRVQEVTSNILDILSQLLNKLFGWAGVEVDLSKIKVDVHGGGEAVPPGGNPPHPPLNPVEPAQQ
jgi:hypothetical protein